MDIVRSCSKTKMRMFPDEPSRLVPVTWYFVPDDRPFLPYPHAFGSRVWEYQDDDDPPFGEMNLPRPWYGGAVPATAGNGGVCGTPDEWYNGCASDAPVPPPWPGSDVCSKCAPPGLYAQGGTGIGATSPVGACFLLSDWNAGFKFQVVSGLAACGIPDGTEVDAFSLGLPYADFVSDLLTLAGGEDFQFFSRCTGDIDGGFDCYLYRVSTGTIVGRSTRPLVVLPVPQVAVWSFAITLGGLCASSSVTVKLYAPPP